MNQENANTEETEETNMENIIRVANKIGFGKHAITDEFFMVAALSAAAEREACAGIADTYGGPKEPMMVGTYEAGWHNAAEAIAADIRARGEK